MLGFLKKPMSALGKSYLRKMMFQEFRAQDYAPNERPVEYRFVFDAIARLTPQSILDVGTGKSSLPHMMRTCGPKVTATDNIYDYWSKYGMFNRHYYVIDDDITKSKITGSFEMITCVSTLEHIVSYEDAIRHMVDLLSPGGHLIVTCPYHERRYAANVYELPGSAVSKDVGYICQAYSWQQVASWLDCHHLQLVTQEYWQCFTGEYWSHGTFINPPRKVTKNEPHHLTCLLMQKPV